MVNANNNLEFIKDIATVSNPLYLFLI